MTTAIDRPGSLDSLGALRTGAHQTYRDTRFFGGLDGLRALSILVVIWHHSPVRLGFWPAEEFGYLGVDLFFVISGFLIVTLLKRERESTGTISLRSFYMRRSLRIFPLYYGFLLALAVMFFVFNPTSENAKEYFADLPFFLLYVANFAPVGLAHLWSLASEEQFYLVWPLVERQSSRFVYGFLGIALAANQLVNFRAVELSEAIGFPDLAERSIVQVTFTPILLGVVLAHLLHERSTFDALRPVLGPRVAAPAFLLGLVAFCFVLPEDLAGTPRLSVQLLMVMLVGAVVSNEDSALLPVLKFRPLARTGAISYGLYVFHIHTIAAADAAISKLGLDNDLAVFVVGYGLAFVAAELSFRFFEMPFLRLKKRFEVAQPTPA